MPGFLVCYLLRNANIANFVHFNKNFLGSISELIQWWYKKVTDLNFEPAFVPKTVFK